MSTPENLFSSSKLELIVPDGSFQLPELFSTDGPSWLNGIKDTWRPREEALFDERLQFLLSLTVPSDSDPPEPTKLTPSLATFLSHMQISLDATYVAPTASPLPQTPTPGSTPRTATTNMLAPPPPMGRTPSTGRPSSAASSRPSPTHLGVTPLQPPLTPLPTPATGPGDSQYANARTLEGATPVHSYIWGDMRNVTEESLKERAVTVFWSEEEKAWMVVYRLDVAVAYVQTWYPNPLLCLTASATLREKKVSATPLRAALDAVIQEALAASSPTSPKTSAADVVDGSIDGMEGFEEVNLLEGIAKDPSFAQEELILPSTRLSDPLRRHAFGLRPADKSATTPSTSSTTSTTTLPLPPSVLRKSYRTVLPAVSAIRVRMRTTFVPSEEDDEKKVILSVEVENAASRGFVVESVDVNVGGSPGKIELIKWSSDAAVFPLEMDKSDIYCLLYAVDIVVDGNGSASTSEWPAGNSLLNAGTKAPESQRPMSIVVTGRPSVSDPEVPPTKPFASRWSSVLDMAATAAAATMVGHTPADLTDRDVLPVPIPATPIAATPVSAHPHHAPPSPVAGSKRHTFAGLESTKNRFSLGKKILSGLAGNRASTPVTTSPQLIMSSPPRDRKPPPQPLNVPPPVVSPVVPPTPAFPSYGPGEASIPPSPYTSNPIDKLTTGPLPPTPRPTQRHSYPPSVTGDALLVSVSLASPPDEKIYALDTFALDIFVFNRSDMVKRCEIAYPERKRMRQEQRLSGGARDSTALHPAFQSTSAAGIIPLENRIAVGPLEPHSCQTVQMRFIALQTGTHNVEAITLKDADTEIATNLLNVMNVVVHEGSPNT